jgi:hypothetical protein
MKRMNLIVLGILAASACAFAQDQAAIDKALVAAPAQLKAGATVIKWKADDTYDTLKKGTNKLVCYDKSGLPGEPAYLVEKTSRARRRRERWNPREAGIWIGMVSLDGRPGESANPHDDCGAGRDHQNTRTTREWRVGWCLDHECRHDHRASHDAGRIVKSL